MKRVYLGLGLLLLTAFLGAVRAEDSDALGLEPVYDKLNPGRTVLVNPSELPEILKTLPGWQARSGHLMKIYPLANFRTAVAFIVKISYAIDKYDHHPEIRNIYGKVYVGFTTYDQGKKISQMDVTVAKAVEAEATEFFEHSRKESGH
jgi:4a-hydroxytetrahydrobiopterin dehydratase